MPPHVVERLRAERQTLLAVLHRCVTAAGEVDLIAFDEFRHRLVWLIAVEQRILVPALVARLGPLKFQKGMQRDHADLIALCVATPNVEWVGNLAELLGNHLELEECGGGLLELVARHLEDQPGVVEAVDRLAGPKLPRFEGGAAVRGQLRAVLEEVGLGETPHRPGK